ncbi:MAG: Gmad2 immunoglobulin-like domain-containing protein [Candidatus Paceibacterota bacterium]|jgi:hypothetical protein
MKNAISFTIAIVLIVAVGVWWLFGDHSVVPINTFEECVSAGNPVMESYPRQCRANEQTFTEFIGNEIEKDNLIRINTPRPNETISSPLVITGEARGNWFFEASFPVVLVNWDGLIVAQGIATANPPDGGDWMTTEFVPFKATLTFTIDKDTYSNRGSLILKKDNPSGLSEYDDALEIPVVFAGINGTVTPVNINEKILNNGVYITPLQVISDSRCPNDVVCVWAGEILVKIKLETDGIINVVELKEGGNTSIGGSTVTLENVLPENKSTVSIQAKDYKFTFKVAIIPGSCQKDSDCSAGFECIQSCGPPVARQDDPPPPYYCQPKGYQLMCPICLAKNTLIDTPQGAIAVQDIQIGASIYTVTKSGERVIGIVEKVGKNTVPPDHKMVKLVLKDGRTLLVSPGHPIIDGRTVGELAQGDRYDGSQVSSAERVSYGEGYTYDLLPVPVYPERSRGSETGFYFANGIMMDNTMR